MTDAVDWVVDGVFEVDNKLERMDAVDKFNFDVRDKVDFEERGRDFSESSWAVLDCRMARSDGDLTSTSLTEDVTIFR